MPGYSLVPVDYQPDFDDYSLVPVDYDPFAADGVALNRRRFNKHRPSRKVSHYRQASRNRRRWVWDSSAPVRQLITHRQRRRPIPLGLTSRKLVNQPKTISQLQREG